MLPAGEPEMGDLSRAFKIGGDVGLSRGNGDEILVSAGTVLGRASPGSAGLKMFYTKEWVHDLSLLMGVE